MLDVRSHRRYNLSVMTGWYATLYWDDDYAIARALREQHPDVKLDTLSLGMIYRWTIALPGFQDEPALANDAILTAIYAQWFEEENPV